MSERLAVGCVLAVLMLWVQHWFPWRMVFRCELPRLVAYVLGVLALVAAQSWVFWGDNRVVCGLWVVVVSGGAAVVCAYGVDWLLRRVRMSYEQQELAEIHDEAGQAGPSEHERA